MLEIEGLPVFKELVDGSHISVFPPRRSWKEFYFLVTEIFRFLQSVPPSVKRPLESYNITRFIPISDLKHGVIECFLNFLFYKDICHQTRKFRSSIENTRIERVEHRWYRQCCNSRISQENVCFSLIY